MRNLLLAFFILITGQNVGASPSDVMKQVLLCHDHLKNKNKESGKKFKSCIRSYMLGELSEFEKNGIGRSLLYMKDIAKVGECKKDKKLALESTYKNGAKFICFNADVEGESKSGFAVLKRPQKDKFFDSWKIYRIKYMH